MKTKRDIGKTKTKKTLSSRESVKAVRSMSNGQSRGSASEDLWSVGRTSGTAVCVMYLNIVKFNLTV